MELESWFDTLWTNYEQIAPNVSRIRGLIEARGERVVNDHVAFRTYDLDPIGIARLGPLIESLGYTALEDYEFPAKKVHATAYVKEGWPRIFLSELRTRELPERWQDLFASIAAQVDRARMTSVDVFHAGRLWEAVGHDDYLALREESEYAAWVAALGLRPNHFTVNVNALETFDDLGALLGFVEGSGYPLNEAGGRIKGSPAVCLEQGATLADRVEVEFAGSARDVIPTCYYEFAQRHVTTEGRLYDGFVAASADRIFESTDSAPTRRA
mgnify:CR=1 FL=1